MRKYIDSSGTVFVTDSCLTFSEYGGDGACGLANIETIKGMRLSESGNLLPHPKEYARFLENGFKFNENVDVSKYAYVEARDMYGSSEVVFLNADWKPDNPNETFMGFANMNELCEELTRWLVLDENLLHEIEDQWIFDYIEDNKDELLKNGVDSETVFRCIKENNIGTFEYNGFYASTEEVLAVLLNAKNDQESQDTMTEGPR